MIQSFSSQSEEKINKTIQNYNLSQERIEKKRQSFIMYRYAPKAVNACEEIGGIGTMSLWSRNQSAGNY